MRRRYIRFPFKEPVSGKYSSAVTTPTNPLLLLLSAGNFLDLVGLDDIAFVDVVEVLEV